MDINIRLAGREDASIIGQFILDLASYQKEVKAVTVNLPTLVRQLSGKNPPFECLIADLDGESVGFALFYSNYSTWEGKPGIYLEDLYVDPRARFCGIGKQLILQICKIALQRGCTRLDWSVQSNNLKAIEFYSNLGASPMTEWRKWRLDDEGMKDLLALESVSDLDKEHLTVKRPIGNQTEILGLGSSMTKN